MASPPTKDSPRTSHHVSMLPSPTLSVYPAVCRICHSSEASIPYNGVAPGEPLISPCSCKGTMGLYHRSCLERWLTTSKTSCCEICKFAFQIRYEYPSFCAFMRHSECHIERRNFITDVTCFLFLTPLAIGCVLLCYTGVSQQTKEFTEWHIDALGLIVLGLLLSFTYIIWFMVTVSFHLKVYLDWRRGHQKLFVVDQLSEEESLLVNGHNNNKKHIRWPFLISSLNCAYCMNTAMVSTTRSAPSDSSQHMSAVENTTVTEAIVATPENNVNDEGVNDVEDRAEVNYEEIEVAENCEAIADDQYNDESCVMGVSMSTSSARFMASTPLYSGTLSRIPLFNFNLTCSTLQENDDISPVTTTV
uniref:RING-CH-type domain-containing protein n=1 Tax=Ascaris lumbricoides TaxID=6252 RepID=A0A9J2PSA1_ASCLU